MSEQTILIVEDNDFDRTLLKKALTQKGGFQIVEAENGDRCLEIISAQKIDLILMDIMMPGLFGTQLLVKIREKFSPIELPIIMVTSKSETNDIVTCLQNGANDYITKPVNFSIALSRMTTHLKLSEASKEMSRFQKMLALDAMISTYNHEINNPLTIAISTLDRSDWNQDENLKIIKDALWRIADIVKKIRSISDKKEVDFTDYTKSSKMIKIK